MAFDVSEEKSARNLGFKFVRVTTIAEGMWRGWFTKTPLRMATHGPAILHAWDGYGWHPVPMEEVVTEYVEG